MTWMLVLVVWTSGGLAMFTVPFPYTEARCHQAAEAFETKTKSDSRANMAKMAYCIPSPDVVVR